MKFNFSTPGSVAEARAEREQAIVTMAAISRLRATIRPASEARPGQLMLHVSNDAEFREWQNQSEQAWTEYEARELFLREWIELKSAHSPEPDSPYQMGQP